MKLNDINKLLTNYLISKSDIETFLDENIESTSIGDIPEKSPYPSDDEEDK